MEDNNKNNGKYTETLKKLKAVLNSEDLSLPKKIAKDEISNLVQDLFDEENIVNRKVFKDELKILLKKHVELNKEVEKKKKELEELEKNKQKEFIDACKTLFDKIDGIDDLVNNYASSLEKAMSEMKNN
jgi:hypothetical protein